MAEMDSQQMDDLQAKGRMPLLILLQLQLQS